MLKHKLKGARLALAMTAAGATVALPAIAAPELKIRGRAHVDAAYYDDDQTELGSGVNVRRARLGMSGKIDDDWSFIVEYDFAENNTSAKDVGLIYALGGGKLTIGQFKVPMGLNELTSSNNITFIERASSTNAFVDAQRLGLGFARFGDLFGIQAMLYSRAIGSGQSDGLQDPVGGALRVVLTPINSAGQLLHLGASAAYEDLNDYPGARFRDRPESRIDGRRLVDSGGIANTEKTHKAGLELAYKAGPFSTEAEYMRASAERTVGPEPTFSGYHVQTSYVLTGQSRGYKNGAFGGVKPSTETGAWEVAARYSVLDLDDSDFTGGEQTNITLGLNYYANANVRFMVNYILTDIDGGSFDGEKPNTLMARAQVKW